MDCQWYSESLSWQGDNTRVTTESQRPFQSGTNQEFLDGLATLALDPKWTDTVFVSFEPLFVDVCNRWLSPHDSRSAIAKAQALARILHAAPHLRVYAHKIADHPKDSDSDALFSKDNTSLAALPDEVLVNLLLLLYRLLEFDRQFEGLVPLVKLQFLLSHHSLCVRYLSIRTICLFLQAGDATFLELVEKYVGKDQVLGPYEGKTIDYALFSLWEQKRRKGLRAALQSARSRRCTSPTSTSRRGLNALDLCPLTACFEGCLLPSDSKRPEPFKLVLTPTTSNNVRNVAEAMNTERPLLITGPAGSGKTSIVKAFARSLGKASSMITLHLNDQTDAKLLLGLYTSSGDPNSFRWQPGVLTTAVQQGHWVLIEDLDRAPNEVISVLLPLLERNELMVPNLGGSIRPARGFRLLATVSSTSNIKGDDTLPGLSGLGFRSWYQVKIRMASDLEFGQICKELFPNLSAHHDMVMRVFESVRSLSTNHARLSRSSLRSSRIISPRDLIRFCTRLEKDVSNTGVVSGGKPLPDAIWDSVLLEAMDCFAGAIPSDEARAKLLTVVASAMNYPFERAEYCTWLRVPPYTTHGDSVRAGRATLPKSQSSGNQFCSRSNTAFRPWVPTKIAARAMESVMVAVGQHEPCLLVGETGTGKTTIIQELARALHHPLTVINLSQQSETSDILGGFKPVSMRGLVMPAQEIFEALFDSTFSAVKNERFLASMERAIKKSDWERVLKLWQEALRMANSALGSSSTDTSSRKKRRRVDEEKSRGLKKRWSNFAGRIGAIQAQWRNKSSSFAFNFIEGSLVKAMRNGEWMLLDEVNLASPETLESLIELVSNDSGEPPSILLSETSPVETVEAHPNFRLFAAMNPATDVGKRELPWSLRSRFSEFYVSSPDRESEDLEQIIAAYLKGFAENDSTLVPSVARLYGEIRRVEEANELVDGSNQRPHFSLRTLTRTLTYATDTAMQYGVRRALYEGFTMSFSTVLSRTSAVLVLDAAKAHILSSPKGSSQLNYRSILRQEPRCPGRKSDHVLFKHYWMPKGAFPVEERPHYIITPFVESNLLNLVRATSTRRYPVLLQGPTSSGKTSMIEYLAKISGNRFVRINNHEHTDLQEYLGTYVSSPSGLQFQDGALVKGLREGHWLVLDELNLAPTDVLEALNRLLDDNRELLIPETQEVVRPHPDFMLFATQNPPGIYGGRKALSRAFRNRFLELHFDDIPEDELEVILKERTQIAPSYCAKIVAVYKQLAILRRSEQIFQQKQSFATLRDLFRWALRDASNVQQLANNGFMLLAERVREETQRQEVKTIIEDVMRVKIDPASLYSLEVLDSFHLSSHMSSQDLIWTSSMRRLCVLVLDALKRNEPVLLVGNTGTGKTSACQLTAEALVRKIHIFNAQQNTETGDLIGAQRPLRNRSSLESGLQRKLAAALEELKCSPQEHDLDALTKAYQILPQNLMEKIPPNIQIAIEQALSQSKIMFEWCDGSLVIAMKQGDLFLLDEISLADDSVLERLNSVLETDRSILLAEKGSEDSFVTAHDGFQFLATMNPGGDYGKKELSPALRNRFTEIWVPPLSETADILQVVDAKLKPPMKVFASGIVKFSSWYRKKFSDPGSPVSIRELLSWVAFINSSHDLDPMSVILHGALLVFIDGLGASPSAKVSGSQHTLREDRQLCVDSLSSTFSCDMHQLYNRTAGLQLNTSELAIGGFSLDRRSNLQPPHDFAIEASTTRENLLRIVRAMQIQKPVLLEGAPGVGKTALVAGLASLVGAQFTRVNLSDQTDLMDLFGSDVPTEGQGAGQFSWLDGPFLTAMQKGGWVLLDEMNLASQSVLEGLNACLDHREQVFIPELGQTFTKHPDFRLFAAQNPHSQGGGRKGLPASFVDRFTVVFADSFSADDMLSISRSLHPSLPIQWVEAITRFIFEANRLISRRTHMSGTGPFLNLRDVLRWLKLLSSRYPLIRGAAPSDFLNILVLSHCPDVSLAAEVAKIAEISLPSSEINGCYPHRVSPRSYQCGKALLPRSRVQGVQAKAAAGMSASIGESVMIALQQNWPCLLVGPSGAGKSRLIDHLGSVLGAKTVTLSMNPDMDTMDLVGGYEQFERTRHRCEFFETLKAELAAIVFAQLVHVHDAEFLSRCLKLLDDPYAFKLHDVHTLLTQRTEKGEFYFCESLILQCELLMKDDPQPVPSRFEWIDGVVVRAIEKGYWLVLDNANLCNPSVLDRLNSLMEPNGTLYLNEHRNADGTGKVVRPHPNFKMFLTMDPRHGELSRAMRNRCVELHLPPCDQQVNERQDSLMLESQASRFECFGWFDWSAVGDGEFRALLGVCFENLAFCDYACLSSWYEQVVQGLLDLDHNRSCIFQSVYQSYSSVRSNDNVLGQSIMELYKSLGDDHSFESLDSRSLLYAQVSDGTIERLEALADRNSCILVHTSIEQPTNATIPSQRCLRSACLMVNSFVRVSRPLVSDHFCLENCSINSDSKVCPIFDGT